MVRRTLVLALTATTLCFTAGCPDDDVSGGTPDGAVDDVTDVAGGDGGISADTGTVPDAGGDTGSDGGPPDVGDGGADGEASDVGPDGEAPDAGPDGETPDGGPDGGAPDVGTDVESPDTDVVTDPCDPDPCTAPPAAACGPDGTTLITASLPATCATGQEGPVCTWTETTEDCAATGKVCFGGQCVEAAPLPKAGEIVITEIMIDPHFDLADNTAEWFEVVNVSSGARSLTGCTLVDNSGNPTTLGVLEIPAGGLALFAASATNNGGIEPDALFGFGLGNSEDFIRISCGGTVIDEVAWGGSSTVPIGQARASSLSPSAFDAVANDDGANWCLSGIMYYQGTGGTAGDNYGTPGALNPACPVLDLTVDWCRLQWPLDTEELAGTPVTIYGRVFDEGVTDLTDGVDLDQMLVGEAGYGPDESDPDGNPEWVWAAAQANPVWSAGTAGEPGNDEYLASIIAPAPGVWDHAFRFSLDGGDTWTYCDRAAGPGSDGSEDGYQVDNAGNLVTVPSPCSPNPCTVPPPAECIDGYVAKVWQTPGSCAVEDLDPVCSWTSTTVDCAAIGGSCFAGACVGVPELPAPGEIIVTEIMYDPHFDLLDATAEWVELTNVSGGPRALTGCKLGDSTTAGNAMGALIVPAGGTALFVKSLTANGNLTPDGTFTFALGNSGDSVVLTCDGALIDSVAYGTSLGFPAAQARSLSLDPAAYDAALNDDGANWCVAQDVYYEGTAGPAEDNYGTPGAVNPPCPVPDTTVDWCRLQWPLDAEVLAGTPLTIYGRVYDEGITDKTDGVDAAPGLVGQAGYGADGTDPAADAGWIWVAAKANAAWSAAGAGEPGNDEYEATISAPPVGSYDHAFRFSLDSGATWTYCDRAAGPGSDGSEDGYQITNAGSLVTLPSPCSPNPCTEAPPAECADATHVRAYGAPGTCTVVGTSAECAWPETTLDCGATLGTCDDGVCVGGAAGPLAGEVIVTEIMYNTEGDLTETSAEWFELYNRTDHPISLAGCVLQDQSAISTTVGSLVILGHSHVVLARSVNPDLNGGLDAVHSFNFALNNGGTGDAVTLTCDGALIDGVTWSTAAGFPVATAKSLSLDPAAYDATLNDDGANWCLGTGLYYTSPTGGNEHYGSPGAMNPACPQVDNTVDWCRLQWPLDAEVLAGTPVTVYGRVYDEGVTDKTDGVDADPKLVGQVGYGPDGSDPAAGGWTWAAAAANPSWSASEAGEPGNDEYQATFAAPAAGTYDHAFRFSLDGGTSWTYCDRAAGPGSDGSEDGYQIANAGSLLTLASPCSPNPCTVAPAPECTDATHRVVYGAPGTCAVEGVDAVCTWPETTQDCGATLGTCEDGVCVGGAVAPLAGDVIVTEIMYNTEGDLGETTAEWFELYNRASYAVSLQGCVLQDQSSISTTVGSLVIPPQAHVVFARSVNPALNGGVSAAHSFAFSLNNTGGDAITLTCGGVLIDGVTWSAAAGFPVATAATLSLDPAAYDAALNDAAANWCLGSAVYYTSPGGGNEHLGTPGALNPACPEVDTTVDWCRLQWPLDAEVLAGTSVTVYGRVYDEGITDKTDGVDGAPGLVGQAGFGPDATDPAAGGWTWIAAAATLAWSGSGAGEPDNDEYQATFAAPAVGTYDHAFRFSLDGGTTWTYCDRAAGPGSDGSEDGYQIANAGSLITLASPCDPNPCTVAPADECADGTHVKQFGAPGTCTVDGIGYTCGWPETLVDCGATFATCEGGTCVGGAVAPLAGDVIVTEIMYDTQGDLVETSAEWFELFNRADHPVSLAGCVLQDQSATSTTVGTLVIPAQTHVVLARSANPAANGGLSVAHTFAFGLNNAAAGDAVTLTCGGVLIDGVTWSVAAGFPVASATTLSLDPAAYDATLNDQGANWCLGTDLYYTSPGGGNEHHGSPAVLNPACPVADEAVDWCRLQWPLDVEILAGTPLTVYGRVYDEGVTDQSDGVDTDPKLVGQAGYGPDGSDPDGNPEWSWAAATPNALWSASGAGEPGNDEYQATFTAPAPGAWDHAFRFSLDGGTTWTLCDRDAGAGSDGSQDGYQVANAGALVTLASPCEPNPCTVAPPAECVDATHVKQFGPPGTCTVDGTSPVCAWTETLVDCGATLGTCSDGACVGGAVAPAAGEVVVTEIMYDTQGDLNEATAEWFELYNRTDHSITLAGCVLQDQSATSTTVGSLVIPAQTHVVVARSVNPALNGGLSAAHAFSFSLNNAATGDAVTLTCGGTLIDGVTWSGAAGFPVAQATTLSLDPAAYDATLNDVGSNWCVGAGVYYTSPGGGNEHYGSPGALNPACPVIDTTVDWCRLQWPPTVDALPGGAFTVYGRIYEAGITDQSTATDAAPQLVGQAGWGPNGTTPEGNPEWTWATGTANLLYDGGTSGEPDNDEYLASLTAPNTVASYDYAWRFSVDGGASWTYCDLDAGPGQDGSEDGYQVDNAGSLVVHPDPCVTAICTPQPAACAPDGVTLVTWASTCMPTGPGTHVCSETSTTTDCAATGGVCVADECVSAVAAPAPGEVIFTEIMYDPAFELSDTTAEWFELTNVTSADLNLTGCSVADAATSNTVSTLLIGAGETVVFARSASAALNGGIVPDALFTFALNNGGGDTLTLTCGAQVIDTVTYDDGGAFPDAAGASISLDLDSYDALLNDSGAAWCLAQDVYHVGSTPGQDNLGTPGALNPACPPVDTTVDWCRLQWPLDATAPAGTELTVYGRIYEEGTTDLTDGVDAGPQLVGAVGFGPDGTLPTTGWTWIPATPNVAWSAAGAGEPGNDEYQATLTVPPAGAYDHAFRFSVDGGATWTYCDRAAGLGSDGAEDGYQIANAGSLTSEASPCDPDPCTVIPAPECDGDLLTAYLGPATCSVDQAQAVCTWGTATTDCSASGGTCSEGQCVSSTQPPGVGDVFITEILYNPEGDLSENTAEWFELYNHTAWPITLQGCVLKDGSTTTTTLGAVVMAPQSYAVFARSADPALNGGLTVAAVFAFALNNTTDSISLTCDSVVIDAVSYGGATFPAGAVAKSYQLKPSSYSAAGNDAGASWCIGTNVYYTSVGGTNPHVGTPGAASDCE
ncbi:MAG: hypothetical protein AMXMBFR64_05880 [Myxococcales bacterium]